MSSILRAPSQVAARTGYFRANVVVAGEDPLFFYEPLSFANATGYLANLGNIIQFNTYANARAALTDGTTPPGTILVDGQFMRDMGKTIHIEVVTNGISQRVASLTKVQKYLNTGESTEGVTGKLAAAAAASAVAYQTGYVVTWSANASTVNGEGVPIAVTRVGY